MKKAMVMLSLSWVMLSTVCAASDSDGKRKACPKEAKRVEKAVEACGVAFQETKGQTFKRCGKFKIHYKSSTALTPERAKKLEDCVNAEIGGYPKVILTQEVVS